jgi:hypothetical protein
MRTLKDRKRSKGGIKNQTIGEMKEERKKEWG